MLPAGSRVPERGLTLLELLVVLVIASLMLTLVSPRIAGVLPGSELKAFARHSAALLREMRSEAVSLSRIRTFSTDEAERRYWVDNEASLVWPEGIAVELVQGDMPAVVHMSLAGEQALLFFPDGSSSGGELRLTGEGATAYRLSIDALSGRVSIDEL